MTRAFLIFCAVGLVPIALSYGAVPGTSLEYLFGIAVESTNATHIFRAVMGLYLAMIMIWLLGAFNPTLRVTALTCCAVFMLGLAAGRVLSVILDGVPHWLLLVYLALELMLGLIAIHLLRQHRTGIEAN
jgi:uncharacterized membrane protein YeaQ/YmgE (transglycosylase-associated protein family)